jgi:hypothetical protein
MLCDVVILSNANLPHLKNYTRGAIASLRASERTGTFNIIVCEQTTWQYNHATTLHMPEPFNYNAFANRAIATGKAPWICVSNNDVHFHKYWFSELFKIDEPVMSPRDPNNALQNKYASPVAGYNIQEHFSGWCFVIYRLLWQKLGGLATEYPFYCADNAVRDQLQKINIAPVLVPASVVTHFVGKTRKTLPAAQRLAITETERIRYHNNQQ